MTETIDWNDFGSGGQFVKFAQIGDTVTGRLTAVRRGTDFNGNPCPVLDLDTPDGLRTITCGQANLRAQIVALKPTPGSELTITFAREEKADKGMKKVFDITTGAGSTAAPF